MKEYEKDEEIRKSAERENVHRKRNDDKKYFITIGVLIIAILGLTLYIVLEQNNVFSNNNKETNKNNSTVVEKENNTNTNNQSNSNSNESSNNSSTNNSNTTDNSSSATSGLGGVQATPSGGQGGVVGPDYLTEFNSNGCLNDENSIYTLVTSNSNTINAYAKLNTDKKTIKFRAHDNNYTIVMSNTVEDIFISGFGQSAGAETLLFLMSDGTVEYMPIEDAIKTNNVNSYGKLPNVSHVIKFLMAEETAPNTVGSSITILGFNNDNSFYDLGQILYATGNYFKN